MKCRLVVAEDPLEHVVVINLEDDRGKGRREHMIQQFQKVPWCENCLKVNNYGTVQEGKFRSWKSSIWDPAFPHQKIIEECGICCQSYWLVRSFAWLIGWFHERFDYPPQNKQLATKAISEQLFIGLLCNSIPKSVTKNLWVDLCCLIKSCRHKSSKPLILLAVACQFL